MPSQTDLKALIERQRRSQKAKKCGLSGTCNRLLYVGNNVWVLSSYKGSAISDESLVSCHSIEALQLRGLEKAEKLYDEIWMSFQIIVLACRYAQ